MNSSVRFLSPAQAAARLGVSAKALRLYEQRGLVAPARNAAGWRTIHCHCGQCRSQSGATFTTWVSFSDPPQPRTGAQALGVFAPTANTMRHFCKICGSHLYTTDARDPGIVGVPFGAIVESTGLVPTGHYFVDDKAPWHVISDGLPQFGGRSGFEPIVPAPAHGRKGD